jgi:hypothetical protein
MPHEFEVQKRNTKGQPSIIKLVTTPDLTQEQGAYLHHFNRSVGKHRLREREVLHNKYQQEWEYLHSLPERLKAVEKERKRAEEAKKRAEEEAKEKSPKDEKESASTGALTALVRYVSQPQPQAPSPAPLDFLRNCLLLSLLVATVVFFLMALFPPFRSWVLHEVSSGSKASLSFTSRTVGSYLAEHLPLLSGIITLVCNVVGIWPILIFCGIVLRQVGEMLLLLRISAQELWLKELEIVAFIVGLPRYIVNKLV